VGREAAERGIERGLAGGFQPAQLVRAALNAALGRLPAHEREAYWASVRRAYNAPYNDAGVTS
jgi:hypothetical protein